MAAEQTSSSRKTALPSGASAAPRAPRRGLKRAFPAADRPVSPPGPDPALAAGALCPVPSLPESLGSGRRAPRPASAGQPAAAQVGGAQGRGGRRAVPVSGGRCPLAGVPPGQLQGPRSVCSSASCIFTAAGTEQFGASFSPDVAERGLVRRRPVCG